MEITISVGDYNIPKTSRNRKGRNHIAFPDKYCVVDTETTGLSPKWDNIIEIGAVRYVDGCEVERFQTLVQPPSDTDGRFIDIMRMSRKLYPEMKHHRLKDMIEKFGIDHNQAHRSISDVLATEACKDM